jgi:hypothetical protein
MAVPVLAQAIPVLNFSKNPQWLILQSDDFRISPPVKSVNYIQFNGAIAADTVMQVGGPSVVAMTAKAVPDDSGQQFITGDGSNSYVTSLVSYFQDNFFLNRDYVITTDFTGAHPMLMFTSKFTGPEYNFTAIGGTGGITTPGVSGLSKPNFAHHVQVWIANDAGNGFDQVFMANVAIDEPQTGKTSVDIHEILHSALTYDYPELITAYSLCVNSLRQFYVIAAQFYGDTPAIQKLAQFYGYYVAMGGLGMQANLLRNIKTELYPALGDPSLNRFLRQGSKNKIVSKDQPEWLTWINQDIGAVTVNAEVTIYNDDETSFTFNAVAALIINPNQKIQFQTGYNQLNIAGRQAIGKNPVYYSFSLITAGGAYITAAYNYVIDYTNREWPRYFVYLNSYGAFQTIGTLGKGMAEVDRTKDDAQRVVSQNVAAMDGDFIEVNIRIQDKFTVNIGYDRAGTRNTALLRDLLVSHKIYLYNNGVLTPIGLNTKNLKDAMDGVNRYANTLEYYPLYQEAVYSEDPLNVTDDATSDLILDAGSPVPNTIPPALSASGTIIVEYGDIHLSIDGGQQVYTAPFWLAGKANYRIDSTQLANYLRTTEIQYNMAGSFKILIPGFTLNAGDQLIIHPFVLNPDSL